MVNLLVAVVRCVVNSQCKGIVAAVCVCQDVVDVLIKRGGPEDRPPPPQPHSLSCGCEQPPFTDTAAELPAVAPLALDDFVNADAVAGVDTTAYPSVAGPRSLAEESTAEESTAEESTAEAASSLSAPVLAPTEPYVWSSPPKDIAVIAVTTRPRRVSRSSKREKIISEDIELWRT